MLYLYLYQSLSISIINTHMHTWHCVKLLTRRPGELDQEKLQSREEVNQGHPLSIFLYGLKLCMLAEKIWGKYHGLLYSCYNDYFITAGSGAHLKTKIYRIEELGPAHVLFIKPDKSHFVLVLGVLEEAERPSIAPLECNHGESGS